MAYNKFKLKDLDTKLSLKAIQESWLPRPLPAFAEDTLLNQTLIYAENEALDFKP